MRSSLTGPCNHFPWMSVSGTVTLALPHVAQRRAVRGDAAQVVDGDELGGPALAGGAGLSDQGRLAVTQHTFGGET